MHKTRSRAALPFLLTLGLVLSVHGRADEERQDILMVMEGSGPRTPDSMSATDKANLALRSIARAGQRLLVYATPAITNTLILPWSDLPAHPSDVMAVRACRGEYEPASFVAYPIAEDLTVEVSATGLEGPAGKLDPACVDIRAVKCWYQSGGGEGYFNPPKYVEEVGEKDIMILDNTPVDEGRRVLTPELLLKDDDLVRTEKWYRNNFVKLQYPDGTKRCLWASAPRVVFPDGKTLEPWSMSPDTVVHSACFRTTCSAQAQADLGERFPRSPFVLVRHGLDATPYRKPEGPRKPGPYRLLAVGRFVEKKGFVHLVRACEILKRQGIPFVCELVGDGPERARILQEVEGCNLSHAFRFPGFLPHPAVIRRYHAADLLIVPSVAANDNDRDGVPNVILEAMASDLPVVATEAGAIREAVRHEVTGLLVPQRDPQAIASAVLRILADDKLRDSLIRGAREHLDRKFDPQVWLTTLQSLFQSREDHG